MASIDWPTTLPSPLVGSIREGRIPSYVDDKAQVGAPRRRKRTTKSLKTFSFKVRMTDAEAGYLRTFIDTTTDDGVEEFNWTHPVTAQSYEVRFTNPPDIVDVTKGVWDADIELEEI